MLKISYKDNLDTKPPFSDIEKIFAQTEIKDTPTVRNLIRQIEGGEYLDEYFFTSRFGDKLRVDYLSTGCKAALILALGYKETLDITECGHNARDAIVHFCKDGHIALYYDDYPFKSDDNIPHGDDCDVEFNGYHFTLISRLDYYLLNEWDENPDDAVEPDLDRPGIEKL